MRWKEMPDSEGMWNRRDSEGNRSTHIVKYVCRTFTYDHSNCAGFLTAKLDDDYQWCKGQYDQESRGEKAPEGIISCELSGKIKVRKPSDLNDILHNLYLNAETGYGILSEFGYTDSFVVMAEICGFIDSEELKLYSEYIIKSISEEKKSFKALDGILSKFECANSFVVNKKTFEDLYKGYVIKDGGFYVRIGNGFSVSKSNAVRFTKKEAVQWVNDLILEKGSGGDISIEDAC